MQSSPLTTSTGARIHGGNARRCPSSVGVAMKRIGLSVTCLMALVAIVAIDTAVIPALQRVIIASTRIGLFSALAMAHVLALCLVIVVSSLVRRGEVALSPVMFLLFGGTAMLLLITIADLAPHFFWAYVNNTAGLLDPPGNFSIANLGITELAFVPAVLVCSVLTLPLLVPGWLAARATRGYRLKLRKGPNAAAAAERPSPDQPRGSQ